MNWSPAAILAAVAGGLSILALFKPAWSLMPVVGLLLAIAVFIIAAK